MINERVDTPSRLGPDSLDRQRYARRLGTAGDRSASRELRGLPRRTCSFSVDWRPRSTSARWLESDPQMSWQRLRARIDSSSAPAPAPAPRNAQRRSRGLSQAWIPWLVAAMVVQAIGLGVLGTVLWSKPGTTPAAPGNAYRTLSAPEPLLGRCNHSRGLRPGYDVSNDAGAAVRSGAAGRNPVRAVPASGRSSRHAIRAVRQLKRL